MKASFSKEGVMVVGDTIIVMGLYAKKHFIKMAVQRKVANLFG